LLIEALRDLNQRYAERFAGFFADHASPAAQRLLSYVDAELPPDIYNVPDMSVWFAFRGDRRSDPGYMSLIESCDPETLQRLTELFAQGGIALERADNRAQARCCRSRASMVISTFIETALGTA